MKRSLPRIILNALLAIVAGCNVDLTSVGGTAKTIEWDTAARADLS